MLRKVLMWLGMEPAWVDGLVLEQTGEGTWHLRFTVLSRPWATEEDIQIVRTNALIVAQRVLGCKCRITVLSNKEVSND